VVNWQKIKMSNFFEKLKKGMETQISQKQPKNSKRTSLETEEKNKNPLSEENQNVKNEEKSKKRNNKRKRKTIKKEKKEKIKVTEEEEEAPKETKQKSSVIMPDKFEDKWFEGEGELAVDVYQTDGKIIIRSAIAGVKPEDLEITIEEDIVSIKGERKELDEDKEKNYFHKECYWGKFSREIILPVEVNSGEAEAVMKNGILVIKIPIIQREKKKKIIIKQ